MDRELRVGDKVIVKDRSYSFGVKECIYVDGMDTLEKGRREYIVVSVGLDVQRNKPYSGLSDTLISDTCGGFWFIRGSFCCVVSEMHKIKIGDKEFEISDESYESFKKQFRDVRTGNLD